MKKIAFSFALALLCLSHASLAQYREINNQPDSIRLEFPEQQAVVIFKFRYFKDDFGFIEKFPSILKDLMHYVERAAPSNISALAPRRIDFKIKPMKDWMPVSVSDSNYLKNSKIEMTMTDLVPKTYMVIRENTIEQLLPPGWELYINSTVVKVMIYTETFEGLKNLTQQNFKKAVSAIQSDSKMKVVGKKMIHSRIILKNDNVEHSIVNYKVPGDFISIAGHSGIGLYRDKFYPELSVRVGLYFKDHFNRKNQGFELIYDNLFFAGKNTEGNYMLNVNSFLSFGYGKNFGYGNKVRTTLGAGLLVRKEGDYFQGNTAKFFLRTGIGNHGLDVGPEFYLTDDFKKFAFGMKLSYTFF